MPYALSFLFAFALTYACTPLTIYVARRFGLTDDPRTRFHPAHTHKGTIPRAGGLAIFLGIILTSVFLLPMTKLLAGIFVGSVILVVMGLLDDRRDISPYVRLATNAVTALVVIGAGASIPYVTNPFTGGIFPLNTWRISFEFFGPRSLLVWADVFAFFWIMWTMNIVGWSAGVDGQMPGFVAISAFVLGILSLRYSLQDPTQLFVSLFAFIVSGAFSGFLPWNFYPQKIMPGYGGKTLAGLLLAVLGILSYAKLGTALLVLGIPMVDAVYTLVRRIKNRRSPMRADRGHLHHRLLDIGWSRRKVALFYWGVSAILGSIALTVTSRQKIFALLLVIVGIGGFIAWISYLSQFSKQHDPDNG